MKKVAPNQRFRAELDEALAGVAGDEDRSRRSAPGSQADPAAGARGRGQGVLGRARYERAEETVSHRNGYEQADGQDHPRPVELERPRVRDASRLGFESRILGKGVTRTTPWSR